MIQFPRRCLRRRPLRDFNPATLDQFPAMLREEFVHHNSMPNTRFGAVGRGRTRGQLMLRRLLRG